MENHTEKQIIFDEYAKSQDYADWNSLEFEFEIFLMNADEFMSHVFAACDLVQKEQQKRIADNATTVTNVMIFNPFQVVDRTSILSESNLIK